MLLINNFAQVVTQIEKERGISREVLIDAIKASLIAACKKKFPSVDNLEVTIEEETGEALIFAGKEIVETLDGIEDEAERFSKISLAEATEYQDDVEIGDVIMIEVTPDDFGRIAAQTAKQVIMQRIREAEKDSISDEFDDKVGTIITGTIQRREGRNYLVNLGRTEAVLFYRDQIPGEQYKQGDPIKVYIVDVEKSSKGPRIRISRSHTGLLKALFELEIPEVNDGIISVLAVAREVGVRAKVAVKSNDPEIGAVGTCVGHMGGRIQNIVKELNNERIDIIEYSADPYEYLVNSLKPAKINKIKLEENSKDAEGNTYNIATIYVNEDQLSLAIGKGGQNVRLASRLTGWKIEVEAEKSSFAANLKSVIAAEKKNSGEDAVDPTTEDAELPVAETKTETAPETEVDESATEKTAEAVETKAEPAPETEAAQETAAE